MKTLFLLPVVSVLSLTLTAFMRWYALSRNLLDLPNVRSSHNLPTPRGGGVAIVASFMVVLVTMAWYGSLPAMVVWALLGSGSIVAVLGFWDDHGHVPARWRLLGHFIAAAWGIYWTGGVPSLALVGVVIDEPWILNGLAVFYLVWLLNLYNFMDGIDGIASVEAICVCLGGAVLFVVTAHPNLGFLLLALLAAVAGFLYWNYPPARIFMGDVGSGFLGVILGLLSLYAGRLVPELFWSWLILMGVFIVDASVTLVRRIAAGQKFYEAHRTHAYQKASIRYKDHQVVTLAVAVINLIWLFPVASLVFWGKVGCFAGLAVAYLPLILMALYYKAGSSFSA